MSKIEWTGRTWNAVTGCDRTSPGCDNCYALTLARRLKAMGSAHYQNDGDPRTSGPGFKATCHDDALDIPRRVRKPTTWFVNSMSDLFHPDVPAEFIARMWETMAATPRHTYQILTKRSRRMAAFMENWPVLPNVWLGASVETDRYTFRANHLRSVSAAVRFLSLEPLLEPLPSLDLTGIDWVIIGGESGRGARRLDTRWVMDLIDQAHDTPTRVFVKQLGSVWARDVGAKHHKGGDMVEWPELLRVREMPETYQQETITQ